MVPALKELTTYMETDTTHKVTIKHIYNITQIHKYKSVRIFFAAETKNIILKLKFTKVCYGVNNCLEVLRLKRIF